LPPYIVFSLKENKPASTEDPRAAFTTNGIGLSFAHTELV
jgi:hypothetical protein